MNMDQIAEYFLKEEALTRLIQAAMTQMGWSSGTDPEEPQQPQESNLKEMPDVKT